jgi:hypothetical protein
MTAYLVLLALILLPFLLGVHLLVVPGLFWLRRKINIGVLNTFLCFFAAGSLVAALYVWTVLGEYSGYFLMLTGLLSLYTGVVAVAWLAILERRSSPKNKPLNKPQQCVASGHRTR